MSDVPANNAMRMSPPRTWYSAATYMLVVLVALATKPEFAFHADGTMKDFGTGPDRTVFSLGAVVGAAAVVSSALFAVADII